LEQIKKESVEQAYVRFLGNYQRLTGPAADKAWFADHVAPLLELAAPDYIPGQLLEYKKPGPVVTLNRGLGAEIINREEFINVYSTCVMKGEEFAAAS
jgi:hypothetical protein